MQKLCKASLAVQELISMMTYWETIQDFGFYIWKVNRESQNVFYLSTFSCCHIVSHLVMHVGAIENMSHVGLHIRKIKDIYVNQHLWCIWNMCVDFKMFM